MRSPSQRAETLATIETQVRVLVEVNRAIDAVTLLREEVRRTHTECDLLNAKLAEKVST